MAHPCLQTRRLTESDFLFWNKGIKSVGEE
jgi:hypothetical protein